MERKDEPAGQGRRPRGKARRLTVRDVVRLSPLMRRITLAGDDLADFDWRGPAAHLKIVLPEAGAAPDAESGTTRTYTPRRFDPLRRTLDIDFLLHGEGPGSAWAAAAASGQELVVRGPGPGYDVDPDAAWYVLAGDAVAIPAIETLLEAIPAAVPVHVYIEVTDAAERRDLPNAKNADVRWLVQGREAAPGAALYDALTQASWPAGDGRVYIGCEAEAMRRIRDAVVRDSGLDRGRIVGRGYWRAGASNHPDHDFARD